MPGTTLDSGIQEYAKQSRLYFLERAAYGSSFKKTGKMLYVNCTKRSRSGEALWSASPKQWRKSLFGLVVVLVLR